MVQVITPAPPGRAGIARAVGRLAASALLAGTAACASMDIEQFEGTEPRLAVEDYFAGRTRAWGMFTDALGRVRRQFTVEIDGTWDGTTLRLDERFVYDDGERQQRVWQIRRQGPHDYVGTAADVVGEARGRAHGRALNWRYALLLPVSGRTWQVDFDDWMFLQDRDTLINRARVTKFGLPVGEVILFFRRETR